MKKTIRLLVLFVGLALTAASGSAFALAGPGEGHAKAEAQAQEQSCHHKHHRHHRHHCKGHHHSDCTCNQKDQHGWGHHERFAEMGKKLALSDQQKAQMKEVFKKNQPQVKPIFTKLIAEKREMRALIQSGNADEAAIRAQAAKVAGVEADLAVQRAQMAKQFRAILTPEQIEKFKAIQKERDAKFDKLREHMNERFDNPGAEK
jgi:Spy/CpxP family protein refolding chaperone